MNTSDEEKLEQLLRSHDLAWAIDIFAPSDNAAAHYCKALVDLQQFMSKQGIGKSAPSIELLERMETVSPHKAEAFLQALVSIRGVEMLCAAWRIIQGMEIEALEMKYVRMQELRIQITVRSPHSSAAPEMYAGTVDDVAFLGHLGPLSLDGKPILDGFHALRHV